MRTRPFLSAIGRGMFLVASVAVALAAVGVVVGAIVGYRPVVVTTGSMGDAVPVGSLAIAGPTESFEVGDVLVMRPAGGPVVTHRIADLLVDDGGRRFAVTRGDANPDVDPVPYELGDAELVVRWVVPGLGGAFRAVRDPIVGLTIVSAVVVSAMLIALRRLWRDDDPDDDLDATSMWLAPDPDDPFPSPVDAGRAERRGDGRLVPSGLVAAATLLGVICAGGSTAFALYAGVHTVTDNRFSTLECFDARVGSVQRGQVTLSSSGGATASIFAVDPAASFLTYSVSSNSGSPQHSMVLGRLASPTSVEFVRQADTAPATPIVVEWSVVEYDCGLAVQRGEIVGEGRATVDVPLSSIDPASSFVLLHGVAASGDVVLDGDETATARIVDANTLRITSSSKLASGARFGWQVVTFEDGADGFVQHLTSTMPAGAVTRSVTIPTPVDPDASWIVVTTRSAGAGPDVGARTVRARLTSGTSVELRRELTAGAVDVSIQVIEMRDGTAVRRGVLDLPAGSASAATPIDPVFLSRSTVTSTVWQPGSASGGATTMSADDVAGEASARFAFDGPAAVRVTRAASTAAASFAWQIVTWGGPGWADLDAPFRQRIDVTAGTVPSPNGYTTSFSIDHAGLVADGFSRPDGRDFRLWRYDGTGWTELHRVLDDASGWNTSGTRLWFHTQEAIDAGRTVSYWLYFGDESPAAALDDPAQVWLVDEDFEDGTLGVFEDRSAGTGWYSADPWTRRIPLTIDPAAITSTLTDEVVLVRVTDVSFAATAQPDGSDIRFTAADGTTPLPHDIEQFDRSTGVLTAWVKVPSLSATSATRIYVYAGAPNAPAQADPRSTWADHLAVWQLAADPSGPAPTLDDEGPGQFDGAVVGDVARELTPTGPAARFDGTLDRFESAPFAIPAGPFSVSAWVSPDAVTSERVLVAQGDPTTVGRFELAAVAGQARWRLSTEDGLVEIAGGTLTAGGWHHVAATVDASTTRLYVDGVQVATGPASVWPGSGVAAPVVIGAAPGGSRAFAGLIGQVRLDDAAWSAPAVRFGSATLHDPTGVVTASSRASGTWLGQGTWGSRRPLTVESDMVAGTLVDYPLLVRVADPTLGAETQADGDDLIVTAADGTTRLDHDLERWDPATGTLELWVRVPALSAEADLTLYLYSSNTAAVDQTDPVGTFGSSSRLVATDN